MLCQCFWWYLLYLVFGMEPPKLDSKRVIGLLVGFFFACPSTAWKTDFLKNIWKKGGTKNSRPTEKEKPAVKKASYLCLSGLLIQAHFGPRTDNQVGGGGKARQRHTGGHGRVDDSDLVVGQRDIVQRGVVRRWRATGMVWHAFFFSSNHTECSCILRFPPNKLVSGKTWVELSWNWVYSYSSFGQRVI